MSRPAEGAIRLIRACPKNDRSTTHRTGDSRYRQGQDIRPWTSGQRSWT